MDDEFKNGKAAYIAKIDALEETLKSDVKAKALTREVLKEFKTATQELLVRAGTDPGEFWSELEKIVALQETNHEMVEHQIALHRERIANLPD